MTSLAPSWYSWEIEQHMNQVLVKTGPHRFSSQPIHIQTGPYFQLQIGVFLNSFPLHCFCFDRYIDMWFSILSWMSLMHMFKSSIAEIFFCSPAFWSEMRDVEMPVLFRWCVLLWRFSDNQKYRQWLGDCQQALAGCSSCWNDCETGGIITRVLLFYNQMSACVFLF